MNLGKNAERIQLKEVAGYAQEEKIDIPKKFADSARLTYVMNTVNTRCSNCITNSGDIDSD